MREHDDVRGGAVVRAACAASGISERPVPAFTHGGTTGSSARIGTSAVSCDLSPGGALGCRSASSLCTWPSSVAEVSPSRAWLEVVRSAALPASPED
ncbi:hypothetical protein NKH77_26690 [Streptomyces sp. M19]